MGVFALFRLERFAARRRNPANCINQKWSGAQASAVGVAGAYAGLKFGYRCSES
jgi:hypothetical protein